MKSAIDGCASPLFAPIPLQGYPAGDGVIASGMSEFMKRRFHEAPAGECVCWGIPFTVNDPVLIDVQPLDLSFPPVRAPWLVFMHTADLPPVSEPPAASIPGFRDWAQLEMHLADYVINYEDGGTHRVSIHRRRQINAFVRAEFCYEAVPHQKPGTWTAGEDGRIAAVDWGFLQTRARANDQGKKWLNWLWAWENPHRDRIISGIRLEPVNGSILLFGLTRGEIDTMPFQWRSRRKLCWMGPGTGLSNSERDRVSAARSAQLDMGQVISVSPRPSYPADG